MKKLNIKPLSVNRAYYPTYDKRLGRYTQRHTDGFKAYKKHLWYLLPPKMKTWPKMRLKLIFGFSSVLSDVDNPVKPFQDILQKKYGFNDRQIFELIVRKEIVSKGKEFILFTLENFEL